jgi:hypothetical protein
MLRPCHLESRSRRRRLRINLRRLRINLLPQLRQICAGTRELARVHRTCLLCRREFGLELASLLPEQPRLQRRTQLCGVTLLPPREARLLLESTHLRSQPRELRVLRAARALAGGTCPDSCKLTRAN